MSTPPFIELPAGVSPDRWVVRRTERAVLTAGMASARQWAILVPGFTGSKEDFIAVLPLLAAGEVGVVAFDQLGQFESDGSDDPADYALELLASDIAELAATAARRFGRADPPHVLGHSFGGLVAQEAVAGGHVRPASLVLLCTGPGALPRERWASLPALVEALEHADLPSIWAIMRQMEEAEDVVAPPPPVADFLERRWRANSPTQLGQFAQRLMDQPDLTTRLGPVVASGVPTTVMWGQADDAWPVETQRQMAVDLGAVAVELAGVGHSPNAQNPELMAAALLDAWGC
jgi:pimeloyl-ACP methyl ester carboxylesterase